MKNPVKDRSAHIIRYILKDAVLANGIQMGYGQ